MKRSWVLTLALPLLLTACGDSIEDQAVTEYRECAAEYGLEVNMVGIVRGPDGGYTVTASDLSEPAASECLRRVNAILRDE